MKGDPGGIVSGILREAWHAVRRTAAIYSEIDGEQRSAAFAYYVLFSIFPLLALLLSVGSYVLGTDEIAGALKAVLPLAPEQQHFVWESVVALERARGGVGAISLAILLWCSLRFFQAMVRGVNRAWHTVEIPWWQLPLKNLAMIGIIASALFAGVLIPAIMQGAAKTLRVAEHFLKEYFPFFDFAALSNLIDLIRYGLGGAVLFYSFCMLYKLAPRRKVAFRQVWLAALLVTLALQACQVAFVNYLPRFINYGIYGAVGGMMLVLMWAYFSGIIIMFGACLCAALERGGRDSVQVAEISEPSK